MDNSRGKRSMLKEGKEIRMIEIEGDYSADCDHCKKVSGLLSMLYLFSRWFCSHRCAEAYNNKHIPRTEELKDAA